MLISIVATQAEMDEMEMTPDELASAVMEKLNEGVPFNAGETELCGFDVDVKVSTGQGEMRPVDVRAWLHEDDPTRVISAPQ